MELQFTFLFYLSPMPCPWEQVTRLYGTDGGFWRKPIQTYRRLLISAITTTWMAVLPTSPEFLAFLMGLLVFIGLIVAISYAIAYYEMRFYRALSEKAQF